MVLYVNYSSPQEVANSKSKRNSNNSGFFHNLMFRNSTNNKIDPQIQDLCDCLLESTEPFHSVSEESVKWSQGTIWELLAREYTVSIDPFPQVAHAIAHATTNLDHRRAVTAYGRNFQISL